MEEGAVGWNSTLEHIQHGGGEVGWNTLQNPDMSELTVHNPYGVYISARECIAPWNYIIEEGKWGGSK